jgi:arsenite methyltransferase
MNTLEQDQVRDAVRNQYGRVAEGQSSSCGTSCCGSAEPTAVSSALGYSDAELAAVPEGANLGLGCGNPQAIAALKAGETVLDLGSGAGFDCLLAARQVGIDGRVIGVDMTPAMVSRARANAGKAGASNVEFRLGEIEHLPVADASVDVIISNCVINLSPDKAQVFAEAFRVLRPGGRLAIADVVAFAELPPAIREDMALLTGCVAGAAQIGELEAMLAQSGFTAIDIRPRDESRRFMPAWAPGVPITDYVISANIEAVKPAA